MNFQLQVHDNIYFKKHNVFFKVITLLSILKRFKNHACHL